MAHSVTKNKLVFSVELAAVQKCQTKTNIDATKNFCTVQLATCNTNKACRKLRLKIYSAIERNGQFSQFVNTLFVRNRLLCFSKRPF